MGPLRFPDGKGMDVSGEQDLVGEVDHLRIEEGSALTQQQYRHIHITVRPRGAACPTSKQNEPLNGITRCQTLRKGAKYGIFNLGRLMDDGLQPDDSYARLESVQRWQRMAFLSMQQQ